MPTAPATIEFVADTAPPAEGYARTRVVAHLLGCPVCDHYYRRRGITLLVAVAGRAAIRGVGATAARSRWATPTPPSWTRRWPASCYLTSASSAAAGPRDQAA